MEPTWTGQHAPVETHQVAAPVVLTPRALRRWPLPRPYEDGASGPLLLVVGSLEAPGAAILAARAALRVGAGQVVVATPRSVGLTVGAIVPETRIIALPETSRGGIHPLAADNLARHVNESRVTLLGPGLAEDEAVRELLQRLLPRIEQGTLVLDSTGLDGARDARHFVRSLPSEAVLTPLLPSLARALGYEQGGAGRRAFALAREAARVLRSVVVARGAETFIAAPDGQAYRDWSGSAGLALAGPGDLLAGLVAGLLGRGAVPTQAAAWGVYLHGRAVDRLARRLGRVGFLADELLAEVPALMAELSRPRLLADDRHSYGTNDPSADLAYLPPEIARRPHGSDVGDTHAGAMASSGQAAGDPEEGGADVGDPHDNAAQTGGRSSGTAAGNTHDDADASPDRPDRTDVGAPRPRPPQR